ncbi:MAG: hypothetical protein H7099_06260 [Gemmatimonadaceae bacterium]|nr:hypothetical protein [Gemmatimonadaceae bacterium]
MAELFIGERNVQTTFGYRVSRIEGLYDAPPTSLTPQTVPGRPGAVLLAEPQVEVRPLTVRGVIRGATAAQARARRDLLLTVLQREQLALRAANDLTRELLVQVTGVSVTPYGAQFTSPDIALDFTCTALDPYWRDVTPTVVGAIGTTPVACPLGSAIVRPVLSIAGVGAVLRIVLRNALGVVISDLQLAGLTAGITVVIDCAAQTIRQGALSQLRTLVSGDFPVLDPVRDADAVSAAWPTLSVSQGTMTATYAKAWL